MDWRTRSPKPDQHSLYPCSLLAAWPRSLLRLGTPATLHGDEIFLTTPSSAGFLRFPRRNWLFSRPLWTVTTSLPRSQPSIFLLPMQDKTEGEFLQRLRTPSAGSNSPSSGLSLFWSSPARHFGTIFFHFWPLVQIPLGRGPTVGSLWSSSTPHTSEGDRVAPLLPPRASAKNFQRGPRKKQDRKIALLSLPLLYQYHVWIFRGG